MCLHIMMITYILSNTEETFEVHFMKKLSNIEAELNKSVVNKKSV